MVRSTARLLVVLLVMLLLGSSLPPSAAAATLPPNFVDSVVASVARPTAIAFTPDGRLLITTQPGTLRVVQNGTLLATPAFNLGSRLCTDLERGLLGIAVDPNFATNRYVYVFYTFNKNNTCERNTARVPVNRVSRFTLPDNNQISLASEVVLIDNILSPNANHNAGDLHFGKDGLLYISVGDGGCDYANNSGCAGSNDAARDQHILLGKILRIRSDGSIPPSNPFLGSDSARCNVAGRTEPGKKCQETWAWGLRNPFRMAVDPNATNTRLFINDVGQNLWEEINQGQAGADYGWNVREGHCANGSATNCGAPPAGMTNPIFDYSHDSGCASITGGAFVPNGAWSAEYNGAYLFSDYVCGKIFTLKPNVSGGYTMNTFASGLGSSSAVAMTFGPHNGGKALYYTSYANGGEVRRIAYTGTTNRPPTAAIAATPRSGAAPLTVQFDARSSSDPDNDPLTFEWDFGDGSPRASGAQTSHTYTTSGVYTATVYVRDSRGATSTATVRIDVGNTPPAPKITSPTSSTRFAVGQKLVLTGSATDAQDGTLPSAQLEWTVLQHHGTHTHPYLSPTTGNNIEITAPAPEDLLATTNSYLEIQLKATDAQGLTSVITQEVRPKLVDATFNTPTAVRQLVVNDVSITTPRTLVSWEGYKLNVVAPPQTDANGRAIELDRWNDGNGNFRRTIVTPAVATTYTAVFSAGQGLKGDYYDNNNFTALKLTRTDPAINFTWGTGSPATSIAPDSFSARWTGTVQPRYSETYTFTTVADDGMRVWVNGQQVIDDWSGGPSESSGTIALEAGKKYTIKVEYFEAVNGASAQLLWSSPSQTRQVIPQTRLFLPSSTTFVPITGNGS